MLSTQQQDLWNRIRDFAIDDPSAFVKYSDKLAHSNGWSHDYSARVIEEYRKFIFLCCILPKGASPSKPVDEAWHLHLTYTHNYWKEFCADVLKKEIHHFPSKGGPEENEKHVNWYNETLNAYQDTFGYEAPADIWIKQDQTLTKTKTKDKTEWSYLAGYKKYLYILAFPFLLIVILYGKINPYNLAGPQFLVFFASLAVAVVVYLLLIFSKKRNEIKQLIAENYDGDADVYQLARFVFGRERSLRAAIVDLVGRGILEPGKRSSFIFYGSRYKYSSIENNPLIIHLLKNVSDDTSLHYKELSVYYDEAATYHPGLANLYKSISIKDFRPLIIAIIVAIMAIARTLQGNYNHQPVTYLSFMGWSFVFVAVFFINGSRAKSITRDLFMSNYKTRGGEAFESTALASAFVFLGLSSISGMNGHNRLQNTFSKHRVANSADSSGGCGGSGCGGSGCGGGGGGCGGGGCGGCGGS